MEKYHNVSNEASTTNITNPGKTEIEEDWYDSNTMRIQDKCLRINDALIHAAKKHLSPGTTILRSFQTSEETNKLMQRRQEAHENHDAQTVDKMNFQIKKAIRDDRKQYRMDNMAQKLWTDIKAEKKGYMPVHTKLKDSEGNIVSSKQRPEVLADHFEKVQWSYDQTNAPGKNNNERQQPTEDAAAAPNLSTPIKPTQPLQGNAPLKTPHPTDIHLTPSDNPITEFLNNMKNRSKPIIHQDTSLINTERFSDEELLTVLKAAKRNKTPGPNDIPAEFFTFLTIDARTEILQLLNKIWDNELFPKELELAQVVTIYKKGDTTKASNYRPISLLNTIYKIYASLIQKRLAEQVEQKILKAQYGFRRKKSTSQPLYVLRRLQELYEAGNQPLIMAFLDWEKAFDKVDQSKMIESIYRLNIPEKMLRVLTAFYISPKFRIKDREGNSTYRKQRTGIRQGCPLSPYLFIILMTVLITQNRTTTSHGRHGIALRGRHPLNDKKPRSYEPTCSSY